MDIEEKENIEIAYWAESEAEKPEADSIKNIINKVGDAEVFLECLGNYTAIIDKADTIVELGAGQCWASCVIKNLYPDKSVTATDISPFAVASAHKWEEIYKVKLDNTISCKSYETPFENDSVDFIFCFASAHHFVRHDKTLAEIKRILSPGGHCIYFYEPSCPEYIHSLAKWRINRIRPEVPEDVLMFKKIRKLASKNGLTTRLDLFPSVTKRRLVSLIYHSVMRRVPVLRHFLPSTMNFVFTKQS